MPPQQPAFSPCICSRPWVGRGFKALVVAFSLTLAGCATQPRSNQAAATDDDALQVHSRAERDNYLAQTKSDPLGAYLADSRIHNHYAGKKPGVKLANEALDFLGTKYRYGGATPSTGFDCSGLVAYAARQSLGLKLPHHAASLAHRGTPVKRKDLKKGDLVFFNTLGRRYSHVGIYLGDGDFVHAPRTGAKVRIENMHVSYWNKRYSGARRLASSGSGSVHLSDNQPGH